MNTRLYQPPTPAAVTPSANGSWGVPLGSWSAMTQNKWGVNAVQTTPTWTAGQTAIGRGGVSFPMRGPGVFDGNVRAQAGVLAPSGANARARLEIYIVSKDGVTVRGTALAIGDYSTGTGFNTTIRNKTFADGDALTPVPYLDGDRIVVVWGAADASGTTPQTTFTFGTATSTGVDLGQNETDTAGDAWVEFSKSIDFYEPRYAVLDVFSSNGTSVSSVTTNSKSPTGNALQVLAVWSQGGTPSATVTVAGCGLTFVQVDTFSHGNTRGRVTVLRAMKPSPTPGALTLTFSGAVQRPSWIWIEFYGVDTSGTDGSAAILQFVHSLNAVTATGSFDIAALAAGAKNDNAVLGFISCDVTENANVQPKSTDGFLVNGLNSSGVGPRLFGRPTFDTIVGETFSGSYAVPFIGGIALELSTAAVPLAPVVTRQSPALGSIPASTPIVIDVTDLDGDLSTVDIKANGVTVRTGAAAGAFSTGFTSLSTNGSVTSGRRYTARPDGGSWAPGALTVNVTAVDAVGNTTTASFTWTVTGASPVIALISPANGSGISATEAIIVDVTDADGDVSIFTPVFNGAALAWSIGGSTPTPAFSSSSRSSLAGVNNFRYTLRSDALWRAGTLTLDINVVDADGNSTSASYSWTVAETVSIPSVSSDATALVPLGDLALFWSGDTADMAIRGDDIAFDPGLETAVILSLFTDRRAEDDDEIPDGTTDRRGYWADEFAEVEGDKIGSRMWLLSRSAQRSNIPQRIDEYVREALAWTIEDKVVARIDVEVEEQPGKVFWAVTLTKPSGEVLAFRFAHVWDGEVSR